MNFVKPWLNKIHKNFFLIYIITTIHFFWSAANGLLGSTAWFSIPALHIVNFINPFFWGIAYLIIGIIMLVGLFRPDFSVSRIGLAGGLFIESTRFILILFTVLIAGGAVANTLANLLVVVGVMLAQLKEPPVNPTWYLYDADRK